MKEMINKLDFGKFQICEDGILQPVSKDGETELKVVFPQKIIPSGILHNITTENDKLQIHFYRGNEWKSVIVEKNIIANKNKIIELANKGVAVNSLNSSNLVNYLSVMENINYSKLPYSLETSQLGWFKDKFLPYAEDIKLSKIDGLNMETFTQNGNFDEWLRATNIARNSHLFFRIVLASEFASPLLKLTGVLGAITHLWGSTGTGKSVALMCGASVWGLPANDDGIIITFNSTKVGCELICDYLQNMPLNIDELETANKSNNDDIVYLITQGKGKIRGKAGGGIANIGKWKLWGISTGEHPITDNNSKGGAVNRIINLQTSSSLLKGFDDVNDVCNAWRNNYGFAGKKFIEYIKTLDKNEIIAKYNNYNTQFIKTGATGKQSMAGAMLMLADELANECIFKDNLKLKIDDFYGIVLSETEVSRAERLYNQVFDWVAGNLRHFNNSENVDQWGEYVKNDNGDVIKININRIILDTYFLKDINSKAIYTEWKKAGHIESDDDRLTKQVRLNGIRYRCICILAPQEEKKHNFEPIEDENIDLPF